MNNINIDNAKFNFIKDLDVDQDVSQRLSLLLNSLLKGRSDAILTPIAKEHTPSLIFSEFNEVFDAGKDKLNNILLQLELDNKSKYGPRSIAIPWIDRRDSLSASFEADKHDLKLNIMHSIRSRLRPITLENALSLLKNSTNSGLPYLTKKGFVKERVLNKFDELLKRKDPCVLFTRTTEQSKTRNVWGFPIADTLNEMRYYSPLLSYQKELSYRAALRGPEEVSRALTAIVLKAKELKQSIYSIDFTAYDTTVKSKLQEAAFSYIRGLFQASCFDEISYIAERFKTIGILTPEGVWKGQHGVPSGSTFTNEVDSIVQELILLQTDYVDERYIQIQGDDGVYVLPDEKIEELNYLFSSFGLLANSKKSFVSSDFAVYLQLLFHIDYIKDGFIGGIYPIYRALNRLMFQERWSTFEEYDLSGKDFYSIRSICIMENCKYHPLYKELVKFILKYDKYSLEFSDQGLVNYVQMISKTSGAGEILNHQYGDNVSGIRSFETYKIIKELS